MQGVADAWRRMSPAERLCLVPMQRDGKLAIRYRGQHGYVGPYSRPSRHLYAWSRGIGDEVHSVMSQDQMDRLQRLRAARGEAATHPDTYHGSQNGELPSAFSARRTGSRGRAGALVGLLVVAILAVLVLGGIGYAVKQIHSSVGGPRRTVQFAVRQGESVSDVANELQKDGLVSSSWLFGIYYRFFGGSGSLIAGAHALNTDMSMDQIAKNLQTMPVVVVISPSQNQYNILAGKRAEESAAILDTYHIASYADFMKQITDPSPKYDYWFLKDLPAGASLEGFLAPGEYTLLPHSSAHAVVALMLRKFGQEFTPAMQAEANQSHHTVFQIVTLASIIQRESAFPRVQKAIAGVFWNRLDAKNDAVTGGTLQADATVQYAMGSAQSGQDWWPKIPSQDYYASVASDYNTYLHPGLPPGPISNPGPSALDAALNPTTSNWLFYEVLTKDGKHSRTYFCETLECQTSEAGVAVQ